jgi:hypothetical protein
MHDRQAGGIARAIIGNNPKAGQCRSEPGMVRVVNIHAVQLGGNLRQDIGRWIVRREQACLLEIDEGINSASIENIDSGAGTGLIFRAKKADDL